MVVVHDKGQVFHRDLAEDAPSVEDHRLTLVLVLRVPAHAYTPGTCNITDFALSPEMVPSLLLRPVIQEGNAYRGGNLPVRVLNEGFSKAVALRPAVAARDAL